MNKKNKLVIRMVRVPEYNDKISIATISLNDLVNNNINTREMLSNFEKEYNNTINKCKELLSSSNNDNAKKLITYWKVGDLINKLHTKAKKLNLVLINYERSIGRDIGIAPSRVYYMLHFRLQHDKIKDINTLIPWSWYCELTKVKSKDKLRSIEKDVLEGRIKTKKELISIIRQETLG